MSYHIRKPQRAPSPEARETADQIDRRLNKHLRELRSRIRDIEAKEKRSPRTAKQMEDSGVIRRSGR